MFYYLNEFLAALTAIIQNAILLFSLLFIYSITNIRLNTKNILRQIIVGIMISAFAILIMLFPWWLDEGIFIDTRTVLMSLTGVFFGWIPTIIVAVVSITYRVLTGGIGTLTGISTIILASLLGLLWRKWRKKYQFSRPFVEFYLFGVVIHLVCLIPFFIFPNPTYIFNTAVVPFLGVFPILTAILALALTLQIRRFETIETIHQQQILLQASIDSPKAIEIYALR